MKTIWLKTVKVSFIGLAFSAFFELLVMLFFRDAPIYMGSLSGGPLGIVLAILIIGLFLIFVLVFLYLFARVNSALERNVPDFLRQQLSGKVKEDS
ncbi:hypothetical protein [Paenibacillus turpanensis]|uniref:hypothetical protein n=1 Tax=Paenibacillus turpanensis TaxID=2689078 RepID=UPI00140E6C9F|nr:hypothetical protein [Paenibacillus turpanensis]